MSRIKFLKANLFYPQIIEKLYEEKNQNLKEASYDEQYRATMDTLFGWADFWKINLEKTEKFEVYEIITNNQFLQERWAYEHNVSFSRENWLLDILEAQIKFYQPEVFFAHDYQHINNDFLKKIKKEVPSIKIIIGWDGIARNDVDFYKEWDLVLSPIKPTTDFYNRHSKLSYHFSYGFETSILNKIAIHPNKKYDVSFVGSIMLQKGHHINRFNLLGYIAGKLPIQIWASAFFQKNQIQYWQPFRYQQRQRLKQGKWKEWLYIWRLASINQGELFGKEMYQVLSDSKITLNNHIDSAGDNAVNMRLFEATGVGACLLTDWKSGINDIFVPDEEIVTYKNEKECVDKIKYLLKNDKEREKIAKAGQLKTLQNYSFEKRVKDFVKFLEKNI